MNMKFISSITLYEATKEVLKEIDYKNLKEKNLVVVPDSFSMQAESLVFDVLGIKATFNISVVGISRLASKLLREHNIPFERISGLDEILFTFEAIKKCEAKFSYFKNYGIEFAINILEILKEFANCEIEPEDIKECDDVVLSKKMKDLRLIYEEYLNLLKDKLDLTKLLDFFLDKSEFFDLKNYNLYFVNFDSFSKKIFSFICALSSKVKSVTIGVAKPTSPYNAYIYETDTTEKMLALAREKGVMVKVEERKANLPTEKRAVLENVFALKTEKLSSNYFLNVVTADIDEEIEFVAKKISFEVHNGARYKDFSIAVPEEGYFERIRKLFSKYQIPLYADYTLSLNELMVSKFFTRVLSMRTHINKDAISYLLSSSLIEVENAEELLKMVDYYDIDDVQTFKNNSSALDYIFDILSEFKAEADICEYAEISLKILAVIKQNFEKIKGLDLQKQSENEQAILYIEKILNDLNSRKLHLTFDDFTTLISTIFVGIKVETVPSYIDAVFVGDATKSYFADSKVLFILGATASLLPRTEKDNGILTDEELARLNYLKRIEPEIRVINRRNRLKLFEVLGHAEKMLYVITPLGNGAKKAGFVEDLIKVFGKVDFFETLTLFNRADLTEENKIRLLSFHLANEVVAEENLRKLEGNLSAKLLGSARAVATKGIFTYSYDHLSTNPLGEKISASQLESYFACPFRHFLSYTLRIKEKEKAKEDKRKIGTFKHELLKIFIEKHNFKIKTLNESEILAFLNENFNPLFDKHFGDEDALRYALKKECLALLTTLVYEQKQSEFVPTKVEEKVEGKIGDKRFVGFIDRVDVYKDYFRIIDYKTGTVDGVLKDLYFGRKLQLFLYGKVAGEKLRKSPAGLYYFDAKAKFKKVGETQKILNGVTLKDNEIVLASDWRLDEEKFRSNILGAERKKENKKQEFLFKYGKFVDGFWEYFAYAEKVSKKAIEEIEEGYIMPKPLDGECEWCKFKSVCKFDGDGVRKKKGGRF